MGNNILLMYNYGKLTLLIFLSRSKENKVQFVVHKKSLWDIIYVDFKIGNNLISQVKETQEIGGHIKTNHAIKVVMAWKI